MRIEQRAYFILKSADISPDRVTSVVGISPDVSQVKESRSFRGIARIPKVHLWELHSGVPLGAHLEDHVEAVTQRLEPIADRLGSLYGETTRNYIMIVRRFHPDFDDATRFGFSIDRRTVELLHRMRGELDVDEYDFTDDRN